MAVTVRRAAYGREALLALRDVVAGLKATDAMAPVTVIVPNNVASIVARRFLARGLTPEGNGVAGIYFSTLPRLAERIAAPSLATQGRRPATRTVTAATIRGRLDIASGIFGAVAEHPSTATALAHASTALRDVDDDALASLSATSPLVQDVVRIHRETTSAMKPSWYDETDLLKAATALIGHEPDRLAELGTLVLYLPQDTTRAQRTFASALAAPSRVHVIAGLTGNARADAAVLATVAALNTSAESTQQRAEPLAARVLSASDSDDEVRCVVREVVQALRTTPAHRIAVLYADRSPYARLLHEHLGEVGITVNGPGVRPVHERSLPRMLLGLLETARTGFRRADVFRTLSEVRTADFDGTPIPLSRWERVSREAAVVGGPDWDERLTTYMAAQQNAAESRDAYDSVIERAQRNRDAAKALRDFMIELQSRFAAVSSGATWSDLASWLQDLLRTLAPPAQQSRMPLEEQYAAAVLDSALTGLAVLDQSDQTPTLTAVQDVLAAELESALPRVGRFGEGVLVAPVTHAIGLDLDVVYVVGLCEDLFPGRLTDDSLLPERIRDRSLGQLPSTRARSDLKHRSLLAAFTCAGEVVASFPRGDLRRHTKRLPSRWLLPTLRGLSGSPLLAATAYDQGPTGWLQSSPSYAGSLLTTSALATSQEWRARAASAQLELDDPAIDAARAMQGARASGSFTRFDGNLAGLDGVPDFADGGRLLSATSLERYAICPHEYFVDRMLKVAPVQAPEESIDINALDIGNLIHESFDVLVTEAADAGRLPGYGEPWTQAQRVRLQQIGTTKAASYQAEGRTGHPLMWERSRAEILVTLDWMIDDDNAWRAALDARVLCSELRFGFDGGKDGVDIDVGAGRSVRFRGSADKVDQRRTGTILVTDIKTGRPTKFRALSQDNPVSNGEKLQLPVYAHAARTRYGGGTATVEAVYWFVRRDRGRIQVPLTGTVDRTYAETVGSLVAAMANGAFPQRAPSAPDFRWVQCVYCNPDGLGHGEVRQRWESKRLAPPLAAYTALVEPDAVPVDAAAEPVAD